MADQRFFHNKGPITLKQVLDATGATISHLIDLDLKIEDVAPLDRVMRVSHARDRSSRE